MHLVRLPRSLAVDMAGNSSAARIEMMAMTTGNSIRVKPQSFRQTKHPRTNLEFDGFTGHATCEIKFIALAGTVKSGDFRELVERG